MNSAVKQLPHSLARAVGRWASLLSVLLAWPAFGQGVNFTQPGTITINDATFELGAHRPARATPYPSYIITSNLLGEIQKVTITLNNINHAYAADLDVLFLRTNDNRRLPLMSDVGLGAAFTGQTITFDANPDLPLLPSQGAITSGTYRPTDYDLPGDPNVNDEWPGIGPPASPPPGLDSFRGESPNAGWTLFIADDKNADVGTIGGWTLSVWTTPVFTSIPGPVTNSEDSQFSFSFTFNDSDTPIDQVGIEAVSSNTNIVANSAFIIERSGTNATVRFTPQPNQSGNITVTVRLTDQLSTGANAITAEVPVVITPQNDAPTITLNTDAVSTTQGDLTTNLLYAVVADVDNDPNALTLFVRSSNGSIVTNTSGVFFQRGTGGTNFFAIAPKGAATGTATLEIGVTDGAATNFAPIVVTVNDVPQAVYGNGEPIQISSAADNSPASPYPLSVGVSNIVGRIGKLTVTIADLNHPRPQDLDIILQGPTTNVVLMGQAGGASALVNKRIEFDDDAAEFVPQTAIPADPLVTSHYRPFDYDPSTPPPAPAPQVNATSLSVFDGTDPNGTWSLYVVDRVTGEAGSIGGGFILNIFPAPTISGLESVYTTAEDTSLEITFNVADEDGSVTNVTVAPTIANFVTAERISFDGTTARFRLTPAPNVALTNNVQVIVQDDGDRVTGGGGYTTAATFTLRIESRNDAPIIDAVPTQTTYAGVPKLDIPVNIREVANATPGTETDPENLILTAHSGNSRLLPDSNIILGGSGSTRTVSLFPVGNQPGTVTVTLTVRDTASPAAETSTSFNLNVLGPASPLFINTAPIVIQDAGVGLGATNAQPYPSSITVSNLSGNIQRVRVTLLGLQHPIPNDIDIMLVGPGNNASDAVILMSDAGGIDPVENIQLVFEDGAPPLPDGGPLTSGVFSPTDHVEDADTFFPPAPVGTPGTSLTAAFAGDSPNGTWSLYVMDDTGNTKGATIAGGWMINFETDPLISEIPDQTTPEDTEKRVSFSLGNDQPGVETILQATSSNQSIVANTGFTFEGTGASRTLRITPVPDAAGQTVITISATIGSVTSSRQFTLTVTPVDDAPIIGNIPNTTRLAGLVLGPVEFAVTDKETAPAQSGSITVTATSSDQSLIPDGNIRIETDTVDPTIRRLYIIPNGLANGTATITVAAVDAGTPPDGAPQKSTRSFTATFTRSLSFENGSRVEIRDGTFGSAGTAVPYPSIITVSGVSGQVSQLAVTLRGLSHGFPDDLAFLLVSPDNARKVVLLANAGGGEFNELSGVTFSLEDSAAEAVPNETRINVRTYRPANYGVSTFNGAFPGPAPVPPYGSALSDFVGVNPNGDWKLYILDDTGGEAGALEGGWNLVFQTAPTIEPIANQTTPEDVPIEVPFFISDQDTPGANLRTWARVLDAGSYPNLINETNLIIVPTNTTARSLRITPTLNQSGTNLIGIFVTDNSTTNSRTFGLTVTPVDDPPIINTATNRIVINEDSETNIVFTVLDVDSTLFRTNASVVSANPDLVPNAAANLIIDGPATIAAGQVNSLTLTVRPAANAHGEGTLSFRLRDGTTTSTRDVTLVVNPVNDAPTIVGPPTGPTTNAVVGVALRDIPFTVGDPETPARQLTVTASSSNPSVLPNANIIVGGADANRLLSLTPISSGTAVVTVRVSDGQLETTTTLTVTVSPAAGVSFANATAITIRDNNTANNGYPSRINVSGLQGRIHKVTVALEGLSHPAPDDIDILLVAPGGQKVLLLSDAGGSIPVNGARVVFDDAAAATIPDNGPLVTGTYRPSSYGAEDVFPQPAPAAPYSTTLSSLAGASPIGEWQLYILDDTPGQEGQIAQGWSLSIVTAPTIQVTSFPPEQNEDSVVNATIVVADPDTPTTPPGDLILTYASSNPALVPPQAPNVTYTDLGGTVSSGLVRQFAIIPGTNQPLDAVRATNILTVTVTRRADGAQASTTLTNIVNPVDDPPAISRITTKTTEEGRPLTFTFSVFDVDTDIRNLSIQAVSQFQGIISNTNLLFFGTTNFLNSIPSNEISLTLIPNQNQTGDSIITITVDDTTTTDPQHTVVTQFLLRVTTVDDPPTIAAIPNITIPAGQSSTNIVFEIADPDSNTLTVTATSSNTNLVRNGNIVIAPPSGTPGSSGPPGNWSIRVSAELGVTGTTTITVTADDGPNTVARSFLVEVVESRERGFVSDRRIIINDNGPASEYPSVINVSGLVGEVGQVRVQITGFAHTFPQDVDILLQSPSGQKVLLISDAGGGSPGVTNVTVTLDDTAAAQIPQSTPITSGVFRPSNYDGNADNFASPAPAPPHATTLSAFVGTQASGDWRLFVQDDTASDSGFINGGWTLFISTQPRIVGLTNLTIAEDATFRLPFTIVEESFAPLNFTFRTVSTNSAVLNTNSIVFSGSGTNWTLTGTPVTDASGTTEIVVFARNAFGQEVSSSFTLTVTPENDPPFITPVPDLTIVAGTRSSPIEFTYGDQETQQRNLAFTVASSNPGLVPTNNVLVFGNTLIVAPVGVQTGRADITLTVTDEQGLTATETFTVTVVPAPNPQFANSNPIIVRDNTTADPYPSTIQVSGVVGPVTRVTVTLAELSHDFPADLDIILVGPQGQKVILMGDAGGSPRIDNVRLTFDDRAADGLPVNPSTPIVSGTYKPSNHAGPDVFPAPAPAGPYATLLTEFNNTNPNGTWSLYVVDSFDDAPDIRGQIAGGWILNIVTTQPTITAIPDQTTQENAAIVVNFRIEDSDTPLANLLVSATTDSPTLFPSLILSGTANDRSLTIAPAQNQSGAGNITISVSDGTSVAQTVFRVTVEQIDQAPVIAGLPSTLTIAANRTLSQTFQVSDRETPAGEITVTATIQDSAIATVEVTGQGTDRVLNVQPVAEGSTTISVVANDGTQSTTNNVELTVGPASTLVISAIPDQTMTPGESRIIEFTVTGPNGSVPVNPVVTGTASNPTLVQSVTASGSGTNFSATVTLAASQTGTSTITIEVQDDFGAGSTSFNVTVPAGQLPPVLGPIADQTTTTNVARTVQLSVSDPDTPLTALIYTFVASDTNIVRNVTFGLSGGTNVIATIIPRNVTGTALITISVDDGVTRVSRSFQFTVAGPGNEPPVLGPIADQVGTVNTPVVVQLDVTDPDTPLAQLQFTSTTSNPGLVSGVTVSTSTGSAVATISLVPDATGLATVTITVSDGQGSSSRTFALSVGGGSGAPVISPPQISQVGGVANITVTWTGGGEIETATSPTGPWTATGNSTGTLTEPVTGTAKYYRIRR